MSDEIWKRDEVQSPCINICVVHPDARICTGCLRSMDEISTWSRMTDAERRAIVAALPNREALLKKRRGGRAAKLARRSG
ncbi:DUF1289 domain-containing protein [Sulfitobacter sp. PS-8MA]|uniref:DUF1289 domain-containing protein n=1 Tax=Sulfitobacter sp. PS-8MA TaxID=3237707 RepID=UPI0034C5F0D0